MKFSAYTCKFDSFSETDENEENKANDDGEVVMKKGIASNERKKAKRSASDVKKWLMRKPSINRKKKEKDTKTVEKGKTYVCL